MYLLVGLGNPGSDYAGNRHNIGFMAVDDIHRHYYFAPFRSKFQGCSGLFFLEFQKMYYDLIHLELSGIVKN